MSRVAAFVDAGFLEAEGRKALRSRKDPSVSIDAAGVIEWIKEQVKRRFPTEPEAFLRAYWYTAAFDPSDERFERQRAFHGALESVAGLHLRLGRLVEREPNWHAAVKAALAKCGVSIEDFEQHYQFRPTLNQKGVDARIVLDAVRFAERRVYDWAILIAGDQDLAEAVQAAQNTGAKYILAHPKGAGVAPALRHLADEVILIERHELEKMFRARRTKPGEEADLVEAVATD